MRTWLVPMTMTQELWYRSFWTTRAGFPEPNGTGSNRSGKRALASTCDCTRVSARCGAALSSVSNCCGASRTSSSYVRKAWSTLNDKICLSTPCPATGSASSLTMLYGIRPYEKAGLFGASTTTCPSPSTSTSTPLFSNADAATVYPAFIRAATTSRDRFLQPAAKRGAKGGLLLGCALPPVANAASLRGLAGGAVGGILDSKGVPSARLRPPLAMLFHSLTRAGWRWGKCPLPCARRDSCDTPLPPVGDSCEIPLAPVGDSCEIPLPLVLGSVERERVRSDHRSTHRPPWGTWPHLQRGIATTPLPCGIVPQ